MSDNRWMRADYKPPEPSRPVRDEERRFLMVKTDRALTGELRPVDDERWEVIYRVNGELYSSHVVANRELA